MESKFRAEPEAHGKGLLLAACLGKNLAFVGKFHPTHAGGGKSSFAEGHQSPSSPAKTPLPGGSQMGQESNDRIPPPPTALSPQPQAFRGRLLLGVVVLCTGERGSRCQRPCLFLGALQAGGSPEPRKPFQRPPETSLESSRGKTFVMPGDDSGGGPSLATAQRGHRSQEGHCCATHLAMNRGWGALSQPPQAFGPPLSPLLQDPPGTPGKTSLPPPPPCAKKRQSAGLENARHSGKFIFR